MPPTISTGTLSTSPTERDSTSCVTMNGETERCATGIRFCRTTIRDLGNGRTRVMSAECSELCEPGFRCQGDRNNFCDHRTCCQGELCNQDKFRFVFTTTTEQTTTATQTTTEPATTTKPTTTLKFLELQSVTEWVVYSVRNELGLTANISGFLESSYSMMKVDVVNNKQVCAQGNFNCYTYLTIAIRSSTELPTESDLRAALNSVPLKRGNSKHQLTAVLLVEAWCGDDALNVSLGYPQLFPCEIQTSRQQRFTRHCVLANGDVAWSEGDKSNCPTENTGTLESILDSLHNNSGTVSGTSTSVEAVNKILATPDSLGALDVTLVSEIINGSLDAAPPSMNTAASYVTSFNQLAGLNEETLRVANRNSRTAQRLIDTIDRFSNEFDLLNSTSWNSTDTQIHIEIAEPLPDRKYTISFNEVNVEIPPQAIANADRPRVKFIVFKSSNLFEALREESSRKNETLFSWVVSAAIGNQPIKELENSVKLRLPHSRNLASNESTVCQYWDWHLNGWSTAGVETRRESENITVCETSHLTNFALLLDVNPYDDPTISLQHAQILSVISYAGCALSVLSLITTLFIYIAFKKVRKSNPSKILMNLCAALLLLNGVFLGLTHFKDDPIVCKITAVLLHYSLLASFSWMAVEAFYMYIALILVFSYIKHFMLKVLIVGWGVPAVIVGITLAISPDNYAIYQDQLCWLQPNAFFGAVLVPICIVIVMNFIVFGLVIRQLCASRFKGNALYKYADKKTLQKRNKVSSQLRGAVSIFFLLGLTWTFAAFLLIEHNIVFNYLFAIFNSLQGFFLFLFYCVFKREVSVECMKCCICCECDPNDATISSFNKSTSGTTKTHGCADRIFRRTT